MLAFLNFTIPHKENKKYEKKPQYDLRSCGTRPAHCERSLVPEMEKIISNMPCP